MKNLFPFAIFVKF